MLRENKKEIVATIEDSGWLPHDEKPKVTTGRFSEEGYRELMNLVHGKPRTCGRMFNTGE